MFDQEFLEWINQGEKLLSQNPGRFHGNLSELLVKSLQNQNPMRYDRFAFSVVSATTAAVEVEMAQDEFVPLGTNYSNQVLGEG